MPGVANSFLTSCEEVGNCLCSCFRPVSNKLVDIKFTNGSFADYYTEGDKLGEGAYAVVKSATSKTNGEKFAIKIVTKSKLEPEDEKALTDEILILKSLKHKNIIRLYEVFNGPQYYYLVTEIMNGGELFDRIVKKEVYSEKDSRNIAMILFKALGYMHSKSVVHRDLKPENLLLIEKSDTQLKIADFGFAKKIREPYSLRTQCGTPGYVAPEILNGTPYGQEVDNWSLGVIIYILLGGYPPFSEPKRKDLFAKIRNADYEFHDKYWKKVSKGSKDLISKLLTKDAKKRITAKAALKHEWILEKDDQLEKQDLGVNLERFKRYNLERKFKATVNAVIMVNKLESLGKDFRKDLE